MDTGNALMANRFINFYVRVKKLVKSIIHNSEGCTMTEQQFRTLIILKEMGKTGLKEMSHKMEVSPPSLCIMFNKLYEQGLIHRETDMEDRRNTLYSLSDHGKELLEKELERKVEFMSRYLENLEEDDKIRLMECAEEIDQILKKIR